jgi:hypothetical protein
MPVAISIFWPQQDHKLNDFHAVACLEALQGDVAADGSRSILQGFPDVRRTRSTEIRIGLQNLLCGHAPSATIPTTVATGMRNLRMQGTPPLWREFADAVDGASVAVKLGGPGGPGGNATMDSFALSLTVKERGSNALSLLASISISMQPADFAWRPFLIVEEICQVQINRKVERPLFLSRAER